MGSFPEPFQVVPHFQLLRRGTYDASVLNLTLTDLPPRAGPPAHVSIGIIAWNEEKAIGPALESLFQQSLFAELARRDSRCEIICIPNGCTDATAAVAGRIFSEQSSVHAEADCFDCRVVAVPERGKVNAWNLFVHSLSDRAARFLFLMDADILLHHKNTLWQMLAALENSAEASVAVDRPCKDIVFKPRKNFRDHVSLAASRMTSAAAAQLCGQLYCIKAEIARNIYLPKDLSACEDGFIKALVCTDFLTRPVLAGRIIVADEAAHTFEAYTSLAAIFKNQKRQMIGQTIVHILVDDYLKRLPESQRMRLAETLQEKDGTDPSWLRRLIAEHLARTRFFWRLYPGLLSHRFQRLARLSALKRLLCFPAAMTGFGVGLVSCFRAYQFLKSGSIGYWPHAKRDGLRPLELRAQRAQLTPAGNARK